MANRRAFTAEQEQELVVRYQAGATMKELAAEAGVTGPAVRSALVRQGCPLRTKAEASRSNLDRYRLTARAFTPEEERELVARYEAGAFVKDLARETGVGRHGVINALKRQGCQLRDSYEATRHTNAVRRAANENHPNWRGGRVKGNDGYIRVRITEDDPFWSMVGAHRKGITGDYGYVLEHRLVMARALGRILTPTENIHHINGDRGDNRLENLQLRQGKHGKGQVFRCADCGSHNIVAVEIDT